VSYAGGGNELTVVREALAEQLGRERGHGVLFRALDARAGVIPHSAQEWTTFIRGALRAALAEREGIDADAVVAAIEGALGGQHAVEIAVDIDSGEPSETLAMPTSRNKPVSLLTVAATEALAMRLVVVVGLDRVRPMWVSDEAALRKATFAAQPLLVLVDGSDPPAIAPEALASALRGMPDTVVRVLWASDLPGARPFAAAFASAGVDATPLDKREGVEPLLDLILSRLGGAPPDPE
jgi:hypothetical protein